MTVASFAALIVLPSALLAFVGTYSLRLGVESSQLTDMSRQRLVRIGTQLIGLVVATSLAAIGLGAYGLLRAMQWP